jgi:hypothetical protein
VSVGEIKFQSAFIMQLEKLVISFIVVLLNGNAIVAHFHVNFGNDFLKLGLSTAISVQKPVLFKA